MPKLDLRRQLGPLYGAISEPAPVKMSTMEFLMIDGSGDARTSAGCQQAVGALFALSYAPRPSSRGQRAGLRRPSVGRPVVGRQPGRPRFERRELEMDLHEHAARPGQSRAGGKGDRRGAKEEAAAGIGQDSNASRKTSRRMRFTSGHMPMNGRLSSAASLRPGQRVRVEG